MGRPRKPRSGLRLRYNTVPHPHNRSRRSTSRTVSDPFALRQDDSRPFQVDRVASSLDSLATAPGSEPSQRLPLESPSEVVPTSMSPEGLLPQEGSIAFADSDGIQYIVPPALEGHQVLSTVQDEVVSVPCSENATRGPTHDIETDRRGGSEHYPGHIDEDDTHPEFNHVCAEDEDLLLQEMTQSKLLLSSPFIEDTSNPLKARQYMTQWTTLYAVAKLTGSTKCTAADLNEDRVLFDFARKGSTEKHVQKGLPHYSTITRKVRPWLFFNAWLRSETVYFPVNVDRSAARMASQAILRRSKIEQNTAGQTAPVLIVPPSEYAREDISTPELFDLAWRHNVASKSFESDGVPTIHGNIYTSNLGKFRERFVKGQNHSLSAEEMDGTPITAFGGGTVQVRVTTGQQANHLDPRAASCFQKKSISSNSDSFVAFTSSSWVNNSKASDQQQSVSPHSFGPGLVLRKKSFEQFARPGDHLTLLSPASGCNFTYTTGQPFIVGLIVSSPGPPSPSRKLMFFINSEGLYTNIGGSRAINNVILLSQGTNTLPCHPTSIRGVLDCGTTYYVYPFLLYCDDFNEASGKSGSAGGCYMIPMGLPLDCRRNSSAVRIIGVTGPGVSTNHILRHISRDIIQGCTTGFHDVDPEGNDCIIFLDFVGFVSDYPACSHVLDVMGHNADCPCHLCFFVRGGKHGKHSQFGYDTSLHSSSDSLFRTSERTQAVQSSQSTVSIMKYLGMRKVQSATETPMLLIEQLLDETRSKGLVPSGTPLGMDSVSIPVVPAIIDSYRSTFIGIDHLLQGLAKDALDNAFSCLPSDGSRRMAESFMVDALHVLGLTNQKRIYNFTSGETNTMGISDRFALLLVADHCFGLALSFQSGESSEGSGARSIRASEKQRELSLELVRLLFSIAAATYFLPRVDIDGIESVQSATGLSAAKRFRKLQQLSKDYAKRVDDLLVTVPPRKRSTVPSKKRKLKGDGSVVIDADQNEVEQKTTGFRARKLLDNKPNLHRLIEAFEHTVPLLNHARQVAELSFEATHQQMKRGLERSGGADRQLDAMMAALGNHWKGRLNLALNNFSNAPPTSVQRDISKRFLLRVLFGRDHCKSMEDIPASTLHDLRQDPLLEHLRKSSLPCFSSPFSYYFWSPVRSISTQQDFTCGHNSDTLHISGILCKGARLISMHPACSTPFSGTSREFFKCHEIASGCVVQACYSNLLNSKILQKTSSPSFWAVDTVFEPASGQEHVLPHLSTKDRSSGGINPLSYAIVHCVSKNNSDNSSFTVNRDSGSWFLPLTSGVRKVGLLHNCTPSLCKVDNRSGRGGITHGGPSFTEGGSFSFITRADGYPPRTA